MITTTQQRGKEMEQYRGKDFYSIEIKMILILPRLLKIKVLILISRRAIRK